MNRKRTMKELTLTLVFTGRTSRDLDSVFMAALKHLHKSRRLAPWSTSVRLSKWEVRDLTIHPRKWRIR